MQLYGPEICQEWEILNIISVNGKKSTGTILKQYRGPFAITIMHEPLCNIEGPFILQLYFIFHNYKK